MAAMAESEPERSFSKELFENWTVQMRKGVLDLCILQGLVGVGVVWLRAGEGAGGGAGGGGGGGVDLPVAVALEAAGVGDHAAGGIP